MKSALLKPLYAKAIHGLPVLGTPHDVAARFSQGAGAPATDGLITLYTSLCGATGFVCGLPGFLMLPITLPANVTGVALLQLHMSAAFAVLGGEDPTSDATRDRCIACLLEKLDERGRNTEEEEVTTRTGIKLAERAVRFAAEQARRFAVKTAKGVALRRIAGRLPLVGGVLGASSDAYVTVHVGDCARQTFLPSEHMLDA